MKQNDLSRKKAALDLGGVVAPAGDFKIFDARDINWNETEMEDSPDASTTIMDSSLFFVYVENTRKKVNVLDKFVDDISAVLPKGTGGALVDVASKDDVSDIIDVLPKDDDDNLIDVASKDDLDTVKPKINTNSNSFVVSGTTYSLVLNADDELEITKYTPVGGGVSSISPTVKEYGFGGDIKVTYTITGTDAGKYGNIYSLNGGLTTLLVNKYTSGSSEMYELSGTDTNASIGFISKLYDSTFVTGKDGTNKTFWRGERIICLPSLNNVNPITNDTFFNVLAYDVLSCENENINFDTATFKTKMSNQVIDDTGFKYNSTEEYADGKTISSFCYFYFAIPKRFGLTPSNFTRTGLDGGVTKLSQTVTISNNNYPNVVYDIFKTNETGVECNLIIKK